MTRRTIRIATRRSRLAIWQAENVKRLIENHAPDADCELVPMDTTGDQTQERPIRNVGGKGLFLKELENALLDERADLAVHSMKDVPIHLETEFSVQSIDKRGSAHDVLVSNSAIHQMPADATIGTSSGRRRALLVHVYKRYKTVEVRGNVETRLRKLDEGEMDGLVLAAAGLERLGLEERICSVLPKDVFVPAAGQGVLAAEFLKDRAEICELLEALREDDVEHAARAERLVAEIVDADCAGAFGAHCEKVKNGYRLSAIVLSESGEHAIQTVIEHGDSLRAAEIVGQRLLNQGAADLLSPL
ncbi:MAG: hydroxymethylbilane synthase [Gammaproteobacteria bacterium]|nr:hydroxymethylbilane synthase [Gammaproteobacteria bacterium]